MKEGSQRETFIIILERIRTLSFRKEIWLKIKHSIIGLPRPMGHIRTDVMNEGLIMHIAL